MSRITALLTLVLVGSSALPALAGEPSRRFGDQVRIRYARAWGRDQVTDVGRLSVPVPGARVGPEEAARWFLGRHGDLFGLDRPGLDLFRGRVARHLGQRLVRFDLRFHGLPVFFRRAVVQLDDRVRVHRAALNAPLLDASTPAHPMPDEHTVQGWVRGHGFEVQSVVSYGWIDDAVSGLEPVVRVDTEQAAGAEPLSLFVHAGTGAIVHTEPMVWTSGPVGAVFPENPATTPEVSIVSLPFLDPETDFLYGDYARVESCVDREKCEETEPLAVRGGVDRSEFVYDPVLDEFSFEDPFSEVNAYRNITAINRWMRETFGWEGLFDDQTWIEVAVGREWYNASFYTGNDDRPPSIVFGQDVIDFAYDADAAFHEFGHAVSKDLWKHKWLLKHELGSDVSMFGIEETLCDILAQTFSGDPVMNSYVERSRTADNDLTCPDSLMGEGHMEARVLTGMGWDVRQEIGADAWNHVVYRTLNFLEDNIDFKDFVEALASAAEDLAAEGAAGVEPGHAAVIREKAEQRGLFDEQCLDRLVPMYDGESRHVYGYGRKRTNKHDFPFGLQWKITAPEDQGAFVLILTWRYPLENDDGDPVEPGFRVHLRAGAPVEVTWRKKDDLKDGEPAFDVIADHTIGGAPESIEYPFVGMEPLDPGQEIFILLSADTEESTVAITGELHFVSQQTGLPPFEKADASPPEPWAVTGESGEPACRAARPGASSSLGGSRLINLLWRLFL